MMKKIFLNLKTLFKFQKSQGRVLIFFVFGLPGVLHFIAFSAPLPPAMVEGVVLRYDKHKVILTQQQGKVRMEVPKKSIVKTSLPLRTGKRVYARLDSLKTIHSMKHRAKNIKTNPRVRGKKQGQSPRTGIALPMYMETGFTDTK